MTTAGNATSTRRAARGGVRGAVVAGALLAVAYIGVLAAVDGYNGVFGQLHRLLAILPFVAAASLSSYAVRYVRWRWLLGRAGAPAFPWWRGFLAYLAGFALTASPGKVGELLRIRYFAQMDVSADRVIACFVFERLFDLIALLILALPLALLLPKFWIGAVFVLAGLAAVVVASRNPRLRYYPVRMLRRYGLRAPARWVCTLGKGLGGVAVHAGPTECAGSLCLGVGAWSLQSLGFVVLMGHLGIGQPLFDAIAILPAAMLLGAASLIPGGIGTTEAAIAAILTLAGVPLATGILAAVGARVGSLWFGMATGIASCLVLDLSAAAGLSGSVETG
jgi:uncharacterized membrane protein YbhN (UPF0104 family)